MAGWDGSAADITMEAHDFIPSGNDNGSTQARINTGSVFGSNLHPVYLTPDIAIPLTIACTLAGYITKERLVLMGADIVQKWVGSSSGNSC